MGRIRTVAAVVALLCVACGSGRGDATGRRIVSSPIPTATQPVADDTPAPATTPAPSAAPGRTVAPTRPPVTQGAGLDSVKIALARVVTLNQPLGMVTVHGDDSLYFIEKGGRVRARRASGSMETILDISREVSTGGEQGLLGLAISPDARYLYVNFTNTVGDTRIREYTFASGRVTGNAREVLAVDQPFSNHNGGHLAFGPDGRLYIGLGDGGSGGDPQGNGQSLGTLLGKMLRIDPRPGSAGAYGIPSNNPFVGRSGSRGEIWAYGLRNPWRYTFDRVSGDLWIADVGQGNWEEIDFQRASSKGGENYGWNRYEGNHPYSGGSAPANHAGPVYEYSHSQGCSVTGGYVYRGNRIPGLQGAYLYGDFCEGRLYALAFDGTRVTGRKDLGQTVSDLSSFGQDQSGELYAMSLEGSVYRIDPA